MKYAVISDVHANLVALEAVLADADAVGVDRVVCLGDVVGYGPSPAATLELVRSRAAAVILGNHDAAVSGRIDAAEFIDLAGDAVLRHRDALSASQLKWLGELPLTAEFGGAAAAHGDFISPVDFNYVDDERTAKVNFSMRGEQLLFVGHTHVPCVYLTGASGNVYRLDPQDFVLEDGKRYLVNSGSVGYPRESGGQCYSTYVIYDDADRSVRYRVLPFSVASVMQRGVNPRRISKRAAACAALGLMALAGAATGYLVYRGKKERVVTKVEVVEVDKRESKALEVAAKSLVVKPGMRSVRAGLRLKEGSSPVELRIVFEALDGREVGRETELVKRDFMKKRWKIPEGAAVVKFMVRKQSEGDSPQIDVFAPAGL